MNVFFLGETKHLRFLRDAFDYQKENQGWGEGNPGSKPPFLKIYESSMVWTQDFISL